MSEITKDYEFKEIEERWIEDWKDEMYYFGERSDEENFIIDTPPPYPTGDFHIGNSLNWCYIDFIARYKRMKGFNVMFPQGWDCHGLPTEVKAEETYNITKNELTREKFRRICEDLTSKNIEKMRRTMIRLGFSIDWSREYITMLPAYYAKTQISFVKMHEKNLIYRDKHPVNWCPRCETAIAFAEVEYESRETELNYINFESVSLKPSWFYVHKSSICVHIATTRPELLSACVAVAVNPDDGRHKDLIGKKVRVPLFGQEVKIIADEGVDPDFGTGIVMICTFGDKQDVKWWKKHSLETRRAVDRKGRMTSLCGRYEGMKIEECRRAVIEDLEKEGILIKREKIEQNVGYCWRCHTPIEILSEVQWFLKVDKEGIIETARSIRWMPEHIFYRLKNWTESMDWDWCISRQRVFATPIPVWYCANCGEAKVAKVEWLPLDPNNTKPKDPCDKCGSYEFIPEKDVLDTWMDSSLSAINVAGWNGENEKEIKPTQLRPQGHDIIRTWAFYTILRTRELIGKKPWDTIFINGMILGEDGYKMSKSRGNIIPPEEIMEKYGADVFRLWAASAGRPGSDILFRWEDIRSSSRFIRKLWNVFRFCMIHLKDYDGEIPERINTIDSWLLSELHKTVGEVEGYMEDYSFDDAIKRIRSFLWNVFADNYIEMVKSRLYEKRDNSSLYTIKLTLDVLSRLLAPFTPYISEEIYSHLFEESPQRYVHLQSYPDHSKIPFDERSHKIGEIVKDLVSSIRRYKSDQGMPLNKEVNLLEIHDEAGVFSEGDLIDIKGTVGAREVKILRTKPTFNRKIIEVMPNMKKIGPKFREDSKIVAEKLREMEPEGDTVTIEIDGDEVELDSSYFDVKKEFLTEKGEKIKLLPIRDKVTVAMVV